MSDENFNQLFVASFARGDAVPTTCITDRLKTIKDLLGILATHYPHDVRQLLQELAQSTNPWVSIKVFALARRAMTQQPMLFAHLARKMAQQRITEFAATVNTGGEPERRVVFLAKSAYFLILRTAMHLKRCGYHVSLVTVTPLKKELVDTYRRAFDATIDLGDCVYLLADVLRSLDVGILHVQCWMWDYHIARFALECGVKARVVCEFYDMTSGYAAPEAMSPVFGGDKVELDLLMERHICRHADAVVHRHSRAAMDQWVAALGGTGLELLEWQAYPAMDFTVFSEEKLSRQSGRRHLVYAGGLIPQNDRHPPELFPLYHLPRAFRSLLEQGFAVDVLHDPIRGAASGGGYEAYEQLARDFETFRMLPGVPPDQLASFISRYDFGLVVSVLHESTAILPFHSAHHMPTKLFAYLEAGLPIIATEEHAFMADFINTRGLGLTIGSRELASLRQRVDGFDYDAAVGAVKTYVERHNMGREIGRMTELYDKLLAKPRRYAVSS